MNHLKVWNSSDISSVGMFKLAPTEHTIAMRNHLPSNATSYFEIRAKNQYGDTFPFLAHFQDLRWTLHSEQPITFIRNFSRLVFLGSPKDTCRMVIERHVRRQLVPRNVCQLHIAINWYQVTWGAWKINREETTRNTVLYEFLRM